MSDPTIEEVVHSWRVTLFSKGASIRTTVSVDLIEKHVVQMIRAENEACAKMAEDGNYLLLAGSIRRRVNP